MTCPCCVSAVMWTISTCGWVVSNRTASAPPYPDAPMTLALILFTSNLPVTSLAAPIHSLSQGEGAPLSWRPSAHAVAGGRGAANTGRAGGAKDAHPPAPPPPPHE